jgi:hypothetical protein
MSNNKNINKMNLLDIVKYLDEYGYFYKLIDCGFLGMKLTTVKITGLTDTEFIDIKNRFYTVDSVTFINEKI